MAKTMKATAALSALITICCYLPYSLTHNSVLLTLSITFGTIAYHFNVRLLVGALFNAIMNNKADYTAKWFQVSKAEMKLYNRLKIKKWKNKMPTYDADSFDVSKHSWEGIMQTMCQSELVHEANIILSFLPVAASVYFGSFWVFMITSVFSAIVDLLFVFMQRFNRYRILKLKSRA